MCFSLLVFNLFVFFSSVFRKKKKSDSSNDLSVQLDVFDEQKESDEAQILGAPDGVDLNSHLDVFYAVLRQVNSPC